jgi:hypothetical protein
VQESCAGSSETNGERTGNSMINDKPTDWKGNIIKAGDEVIFVSTKPFFGESQLVIMNFKEGTCEKIGEPYVPPKHIWQPSAPVLIIKHPMHEDQLAYEMDFNGTTVVAPLSMATFGMQDSDVICIKGKSDSEEEYYKEYFKA